MTLHRDAIIVYAALLEKLKRISPDDWDDETIQKIKEELGISELEDKITDTNARFTNYYTKDESYPDTTVDELLEEKQDKVYVYPLTFRADSQDHVVGMLLANAIAEVTFVNYIDVVPEQPVTGYKTEYCFTFDVGDTVPTLTLPDDIVWAEELELEANTHYVVLISYENGAYYGDWKSYPITVEP